MNIFSGLAKNFSRRLEASGFKEAPYLQDCPPAETIGMPTHVLLADTNRVMVNRDRCEYAESAGRYTLKPRGKRPGGLLLDNLTAGYFNR